MKKKIRGLLNHKAVSLYFALLFVLNYGVKAQSTSYNLNSVPITGTQNSAFGTGVLISNTIGDGNTGVGISALASNTWGGENTGVGIFALASNTIGGANTAVGLYSLYSNTAGYLNSAYGGRSLWQSLGSQNTAVGYYALGSNTTGSFNTAIGHAADVGSGSLINATAIGWAAIVNNSNSIQLGNSSVTSIYAGVGTNTCTFITGKLQVTGGTIASNYVLTSDAVGNATWQPASGGGAWSLTGNLNTIDGTNFIGTTDNIPFNIRVNNQRAGRLDATLKNTFYGVLAGNSSITEGSNNTAIGYSSLPANTTGYSNVAIGWNSLLNNTSGWANTAVGVGALNQNISEDGNSAFGLAALFENRTGKWNTGLGANALGENVTGSYNTGCGLSALFFNKAGSKNTACGLSALENNITGNSNTALGYFADVNNSALQNSTAIGAGALATASDMVVIGNTAPGMVIGGYANWTNLLSDSRFKENVTEDVPGLKFITKLRPVTYTINIKKFEEHSMQNMPDSIKVKRMQSPEACSKAAGILKTGFIAQEVEKIANEIGYDFDGVNAPKNPTDNYSLAYSQFVVPLVKSVQELSKQNEDLKKEIDELRAMIKNITSENKEGIIKITGSNADAQLFQNAPNPFNKSTIIRYSIPSDARKANIAITSLDGIKVSEFNLISNKGQGIEITGGSLSVGTYIYSLFVDDKLIDSKKMILTR